MPLADPPRFLLYSHDSCGLGHLRRSLSLAEAMVQTVAHSSALIVTGSPCASHFALPERVDVLKLPAVGKEAEGAYVPRYLPLSIEAVVALRAAVLERTFDTFRPHLLLVDHQVVGMRGELLGLLRRARRSGTRTVLGIRDVIDRPEVVARDWGRPECRWALSHGYDRVCVYGEPSVFDPRAEYPFPPELRRRVEFVGYVVRPGLGPPVRERRVGRGEQAGRGLLVTMGGGEDGAARIELTLDALALAPASFETTVVTGPLSDRERVRAIKQRARRIGGIEVRRFHADLPALLRGADAAVTMAGYNTCVELMHAGVPAVFLPRTRPREEQAIRAACLERLGFGTSLVEPSAAELRAGIEAALQDGRPCPAPPSLAGARRLADVAASLLERTGARFVVGGAR